MGISGRPSKVTMAIIATLPDDWTIKRYVSEVLGLRYNTFNYRLKVGRLHIEDYLAIMKTTGKTWEELFGDGSAQVRPVEVRVSRQGEGAIEPGHLVKEYPPEEKKKEPVVEAPSFVVADIELDG